MQQKLVLGGVVVALALSGFAFFTNPVSVDKEVIEQIVQQFGGSAGPLHTEYQEFEGGVKFGNNIATSTFASATLSPSQMREWLKSDVVVVTPTGANADKTITFSASSTLTDVLPKTGDLGRFCVLNATSGPKIILAGGTGTTLSVASSTGAVLGTTDILAGEVGCFTVIRGHSTATTFDFLFNFTTFK